MIFSTLLSLSAGAQVPPTPSDGGCDASSLQGALDRAELAFVEMDQGTFDLAAADARESLGCFTAVLTPVQAASYHRMNALGAFLVSDHAGAVLHFGAVLGTQPGYSLPEDIAPVGHPLHGDFERAKQFADDSTFPLEPPAKGWLQIDGRRSGAAPAGRPFLFQWIDPTGAPKSTAWVNVGAPVPNYELAMPAPAPAPAPVAVAPAPLPVPVQPQPTGGKGGGAGLAIAGVSAAAVGAGLYGGAFVVRGSYQDAVAAGDKDKILSTHGTTNVLTIAGAGLLGSGALLVFVGAL